MNTRKPTGVIGAGSFGTTIATLLAENGDVFIYARRKEVVKRINRDHQHLDLELSDRIRATDDISEICEQCNLLFPAVPSKSFAKMIKTFAPHLRPYHMMIHCTKGFDLMDIEEESLSELKISRANIRTMSEVILQESLVKRVGALAGPNLAKEIQEGNPTASVIASPYDEIIDEGQKALNSDRFFVFASHDMIGAELAGAFKNIIALGTGMLDGMNMGKNVQAMLITRGLREMIYIGKAMGADSRAFLGTAGIGDLIATATSPKSRNYSVGYRMGKGDKLEDILEDMEEVAEGVRTLKIAQQLALYYDVHVPIVRMLYRVIYQNYNIEEAISFLMKYPFAPDVDFL
jgi:glycerol-3-phosphate dehydrogenase (NAD(P)+)